MSLTKRIHDEIIQEMQKMRERRPYKVRTAPPQIEDDTRTIANLITLLERDWLSRNGPRKFSYPDVISSACEDVTKFVVNAYVDSIHRNEFMYVSGVQSSLENERMHDAYLADSALFVRRFREIYVRRLHIINEIVDACDDMVDSFANTMSKGTELLTIAIASITERGDPAMTTHCIDIQRKFSIKVQNTNNVVSMIMERLLDEVAMMVSITIRITTNDLSYDEMALIIDSPYTAH